MPFLAEAKSHLYSPIIRCHQTTFNTLFNYKSGPYNLRAAFLLNVYTLNYYSISEFPVLHGLYRSPSPAVFPSVLKDV